MIYYRRRRRNEAGKKKVRHIRKTKEERQREIRKAALTVFLKKGYRQTTMEDIIAATSLSKGGFYHYYGSTKEILIDIMRCGNYQFFEEHHELKQVVSREELCATLTQSMLAKILQEKPEKKLFLMFAYEMLYDPDLESIYLQFEQDSLALLEKIIQGVVPNARFEATQDQEFFISRLINALLFSQNLFSNKAILQNGREQLYQIFYGLFRDFLDFCGE
jgi:AcrR family transcriptional regulator